MATKYFPESSNVISISHKGTTMTVVFRKTGKYEYYGVPEYMYNEAVKAESIGHWVYQHLVKGKFKFKFKKVNQ